MPLSVLSVAFPFAPVLPDAVGGAEQILNEMDQALTAQGERSVVVACEGSQVAGQLYSFPLPKDDVLTRSAKAQCRAQCQAAIDRVLASERVDLVHMHGLDCHEYALPAEVPVLVTLHLPIAWYPRRMWSSLPGNVQLCCVSASQRRSCPREMPECVVVENGVALPPPSATRERENFAVVMGRICPEKNAHAALMAGTLAGTRVLLAGQVFPYREHLAYFEEKIKPLLESSGGALKHEFLGPVSSRNRQDLLARAKCLLHPTLAPETSSLVAMEALAAGAPVIAYRSGALVEIVEDGVTGFLVNGVEEMAEAMRRADTISPEACRRAAEQRFSRERMVQGYFELYGAMLRGQRTHLSTQFEAR